MGENIICPNCGASAKGYGICEYCGSHITKPMSTTTQTNQAKPTASFNEKVSKFHKVEAFDSGVAVVSIGDLYGAINESGDMILPLKFNEIDNYKGRLLARHADGATLYDSRGISIARGFIHYIWGGDGEFLIKRDNRQSILDKDNNLHQVSLPEGISIYKYLGYGCYLVYDVKRKLNDKKTRFIHGVALINKLLLPCHYSIHDYCDSDYDDFGKENRNLILIEDEDVEDVYRSGIYDLEKQKIILPCQYYFGYYRPKQYKNKLIVVQNRSWQYGVFDTHGQNMVIPTIYKDISLRENRVCVVTKKKLFGDKTTIIQL